MKQVLFVEHLMVSIVFLFNSFYGAHVDVIEQTRETVFHRNIQTPRREMNIRRAEEHFDEIRGVWRADETLSRVFEISSQSKRNKE